MITVCKGCTDRVVGCHSKCPKYLEEKEAHLEELRKINEIRAKECDCITFEVQNKLATIKRTRKKNRRRF